MKKQINSCPHCSSKTFSTDEGLKVQKQQLDRWAKVLKPSVFKRLLAFVEASNATKMQTILNPCGHDLKRGGDLDQFVSNIMYQK